MTDPIVPRTCQWKPSPPPRKSEMTESEFVASFANKKIDAKKAVALLKQNDPKVDETQLEKQLDLNSDRFVSGEVESRMLFNKLSGGTNTIPMVSGNFTSSTGNLVDKLQLLAEPTTPAEKGDWSAGAQAGFKAIQDNKQRDLDQYNTTGLGRYYGDHSSYECKRDQADPDPRAMTPTSDAEKEQQLRARFPKGATETDAQFDQRIKSLKGSMQATSCIGWTMENIGAAYKAAGKEDRWKEIERTVIEKGSKGTDLALELQKDGWKGIYWNPDTKNPDSVVRNPGEHTTTARDATRTGSYYGIKVDQADQIINYQPTAAATGQTPASQAGLDKLKQVPFYFGVANGGVHTFVGSHGSVVESHYDTGPFDRSKPIIEETKSLADWNKKFGSGVIMVPPDSWPATQPAGQPGR